MGLRTTGLMLRGLQSLNAGWRKSIRGWPRPIRSWMSFEKQGLVDDRLDNRDDLQPPEVLQQEIIE
jgi:hypothetical protein